MLSPIRGASLIVVSFSSGSGYGKIAAPRCRPVWPPVQEARKALVEIGESVNVPLRWTCKGNDAEMMARLGDQIVACHRKKPV